VYFGQTEIARRGYGIFVTSIEEFLAEVGAEAAPTLSQRLVTALLSAAHGVISLPLGTPTMKWRDVRAKRTVGDRQPDRRVDDETRRGSEDRIRAEDFDQHFFVSYRDSGALRTNVPKPDRDIH
jgi:hypothetical protein